MNIQSTPTTIVIFGGSGDLTKIGSQVNPVETSAEFDLFSDGGILLLPDTNYIITIQTVDC